MVVPSVVLLDISVVKALLLGELLLVDEVTVAMLADVVGVMTTAEAGVLGGVLIIPEAGVFETKSMVMSSTRERVLHREFHCHMIVYFFLFIHLSHSIHSLLRKVASMTFFLTPSVTNNG